MTTDWSYEAFQDAGGHAHVNPSSSSSTSNVLDTVFDFTQLQGKDAGQQVCQRNEVV